jgi:hypothetical protein
LEREFLIGLVCLKVVAMALDCDAGSGEVNFRQALALAESRGMRPLVAHCRLGLGKLYRRSGKHWRRKST